MKIKSLSNKRKYSIIGAILIVVVATGAFAYAYVRSTDDRSQSSAKEDSSRVDGVDYTSPTSEQTKAGNDKKTETIERDSASPEPTTALNVSITASQQNGATVQIRTLIDSVVAGGSCQLELSQGSKKVTKTASIQALPSSSTCQGFDIPVNELSGGSWAITVTVTSESASGNAKGTVTVAP